MQSGLVLFVRVRNPEHLARVVKKLGKMLYLLDGFVFPKFSVSNSLNYFHILKEINVEDKKIYAMPVLESSDLAYSAHRYSVLIDMKNTLNQHKNMILNIRIGIIDLLGAFSLRRTVGKTIYDSLISANLLSDILSFFLYKDESYVISAPIYEHIKDWNGLFKEANLDIENGFIGKSIIHPSQFLPALCAYPVLFEDYLDSEVIMKSYLKDDNGVVSSKISTRMNEIKPHLDWAKKTLIRAKIFGVLTQGVDNWDLFQATQYAP